MRDLPVHAGISREAVDVSVKFLERHDCAVLGTAGGAKVARLTERGRGAQRRYHRIVADVADAWRERYGTGPIEELQTSLRALLSDHDALVRTLTPYPDGWRAHPPYQGQAKALLADPAAGLPHYPTVSHRGGFPDGS